MTTPAPTKIEIKNVKHTFTPDERNQIGGDLARAIGTLRGVSAEFDQVKASYKAKTTEAEAKIDNLSTSLMNGFDMRNESCRVVFRVKEKQKDYYLESESPDGVIPEGLAPVATEQMTADDFQTELLQAESVFDHREEIELFKPAGEDRGILIVGKFGGKWFSALRVNIGKLKMNERLDSEQQAFKERKDAVSHAIKRVNAWSKENLKELAKGFQDSFSAVEELHRERAE